MMSILKIKKLISILIACIIIISNFCLAAVVSDNDGSAFITKAEFDSLKNNFQAQIDGYNSGIDAKIDSAIASYLAGIKISTTEYKNFFNGLTSKFLVCDTSKINDIKRGRAALDYTITTGHVADRPNIPQAGIALYLKRDSKKTFEMFMIDNNKFRYVDDATISLKATAASGLLETGTSAVTYVTDVVKMRWHASPWASGSSKQEYKQSKDPQMWKYWSDRLDDFNYFQWYGTDFNFGFAGNDKINNIFGTVTASTNWSAPEGNEINFCFDKSSGQSQVWVKGPDILPSDIVANTLVNYKNLTTGTDRYYYDDPTSAGVTTTGNGARQGGGWETIQLFENPIWVTYGDYNHDSTTITGGTGGWYEPAPNTYKLNPLNVLNNISDDFKATYASWGYTGSIVQGVPIGLFEDNCTVEFDIDTTSLGQNSVLAFNKTPFTQSYILENTPKVTNLDIYIDGAKLTTTGSKTISAGNHTVKFEIKATEANPMPVFIKVGWLNTYTGTNRKSFTLPLQYKQTNLE